MSVEKSIHLPAPYWRYVWAVAEQTLSAFPRRSVTYLAAFVAFAPVIIPVALVATVDLFFDPEGDAIFIRLVQLVYVAALCPLIALFYGGMLVGEDVENNTLPYVLTRPIPRSAWVLGRFLGYWVSASALVVGSMWLSFTACTFLRELSFTDLGLFLKFAFPVVMGLGGYGAVCLFLGALTRRPMVAGIFLFFFWQRIALMLPGYVDFITIEKYVSALLPEVEGMPSVLEMVVSALNVEKLLVQVGPLQGGLTLVGIMIGFVALTAYFIRAREYTSAHSAGA